MLSESYFWRVKFWHRQIFVSFFELITQQRLRPEKQDANFLNGGKQEEMVDIDDQVGENFCFWNILEFF